MRKLLVCLSVAFSLSVAAQWTPLQPGEAVMTCYSGNNSSNPVMALVDIREPSVHAPGFNQNWAPPAQHPPSWTTATIGEVFGIALDDASPPNIYVTSTAVYESTYGGVGYAYAQNTPATGQVYKVNGTTGVAAPFGPPLPNSGQGLGNIAYDALHKQFFVTNFQDGRIYRLNMSGTQSGPPFDPFGTAPATVRGFAPLGQRLWGVGVFRNRVYFGRWSSDFQVGAQNTVWSVAINPLTGDFSGGVGTAPDVTLPLRSGRTMPVSDIEFNSTGRMLVSEHGMKSTVKEIDAQPHEARVLEYVLSGTTWIPSASVFSVGVQSSNAAGGVDYACPLNRDPAYVVMTGDQLQFGNPYPHYVYGLQITKQTGGAVANSYIIDADGKILASEPWYDKTQIGDVDVFNTCDRKCLERTTAQVLCAADGSGDYLVTFSFKNLTNDIVYHAFIVGLPANVTATPTYANFSSNPIQPGGTGTVGPIRIHGAPPGVLTLTLSIHNQDLEQCCASEVRIELPPCECAQIVKSNGPSCSVGGFAYSFDLQNLFPGLVSYVLIAPDTPSTATFTPNVFHLTTPMTTGATQQFNVTIGNVGAGQQVCFRISTHNERLDECCSIRQCVTMPRRCWYFPYDWIAFDGTFLSINASRVFLDNSAGNPGVSIPLPAGATGATLQWEPIPTATLAPGASLEQRYFGTAGGGADRLLATLASVRAATGVELRTAFPGYAGTRRDYEFYRNGEQVGVQSGVDAPVLCADCQPAINTEAGLDALGAPTARYAFLSVNVFTVAGSPRTYEADEVRIIMADDLAGITRLSRLELQARGIPHIAITAFDVTTDCNGDGVPDAGNECGPPPVSSVSLNTGFDEVTNTLLPIGALPSGTSDDDWSIVAPGPSRPAKVVIDPHPNWPAPLPGTRWLSVDANRGTSLPGVTQYSFERCFCLASGARDVTLDLQLRADNEASVFLNDQRLAGPGGAFSAAPLAVRRTGSTGDGLFRAGRNCVRIDVNDFGFFTGLTLSGTVENATESCP
jgi:hypothetical protein